MHGMQEVAGTKLGCYVSQARCQPWVCGCFEEEGVVLNWIEWDRIEWNRIVRMPEGRLVELVPGWLFWLYEYGYGNVWVELGAWVCILDSE